MRPEDLLARLEAGHEYDPMYGQLCNERDQLKAENAKLRELAGIMAYCMQERNCDWCKVNGGTGEVTEPAGCDVLLDLLRELGIEVPS